MQDQEKLARLRRERKDAVREEVAARKELARLNNEARVLEVRSQLDAKLKDRNARRAELLRRESARVASDREARVAAAAERVATTAADRQNRARAAPTARAVPPVRPDPTRVDDDDARDARRLAFARRRRASRRDAAAADRAARARRRGRQVGPRRRDRRRGRRRTPSPTLERCLRLDHDRDDRFPRLGRRRRGCRGGSHRDGRRDRETRRDVVVIPRETARSSGRGGRRGGEGGGGGGGGTRQGGLGGRGVALPARAERPSKLAAARMRRDAAKAEAAAAAARANASIDASSLERKSAATTMQSAWRRRMARRAVALARVAAGSPRVPTRGVPTRGVPTRRSALVDESEGTALGEAGRELEREGSWSLEKVAGEVVVTPRGSRSAASAGSGPGPGSAASARRSRGHTYSALGTFDTDSPFSRVDDDEVESKRSAWRGEVVSALGSRGVPRATRDGEAAETKSFADASTADLNARAMVTPAGSSVVDESEAPASLTMVDVLAAAAAATSPRRVRRAKTRREKKLAKLPFAAAGAAIRGVKRAGGGLVRGVGGGLLRGVGGVLRGLGRRREDRT